MKKLILKSCLMIFAASLVFIFTSPIAHSDKTSNHNVKVSEIENYKHWSRVNAKPIQLDAQVSVMCAPASAVRVTTSPHTNKFITVFVNDLGRKAMMNAMHPQFPRGAIIVKEKLASATSATPELLTAMVKREKGFNPQSNDWEFMVLSGDAKTVIERGKLENCITCHTAQRSNDFVFRYYLPGLTKGSIVKLPSPKGN